MNRKCKHRRARPTYHVTSWHEFVRYYYVCDDCGQGFRRLTDTIARVTKSYIDVDIERALRPTEAEIEEGRVAYGDGMVVSLPRNR
jgi:hypothetical protein